MLEEWSTRNLHKTLVKTLLERNSALEYKIAIMELQMKLLQMKNRIERYDKSSTGRDLAAKIEEQWKALGKEIDNSEGE